MHMQNEILYNIVYKHEINRKLVPKSRKLNINAHETINYVEVDIKMRIEMTCTHEHKFQTACLLHMRCSKTSI